MFGADPPAAVSSALSRCAAAGEDASTALALARELGTTLPAPGAGATATRWAALAALARVNLTVARVVEAHTDALAILAEAGEAPDDRTWGVFAAEAPDAQLTATVTDGRVRLTGVKPWCSLGGRLDAALVTAHVGGQRQLFAVDLRGPGVRADPARGWVARGLRTVTSGPVRFDDVPARPVGDPGWYLRRPGFAWGGLGVAACWHGGAQGLGDAVRQHAQRRGGPLDLLHLGAVDSALFASHSALTVAATEVDAPPGEPDAPAVLALRVRAVVATAAERVLHQAGHALGPAPLAFDAEHAARVADLTLYVRQHHGERDLADLGSHIAGSTGPA